MTAKKMFEKLGYEYEHIPNGFDYTIKYFIREITHIRFNLIDKSFIKYTSSDSPFEPIKPEHITMNELQAINKQVEEKGWLDETRN